MRLAQDIRNAFDVRSRADLERALIKVEALERASLAPALICTKCGVNRLERPCALPQQCPIKALA